MFFSPRDYNMKLAKMLLAVLAYMVAPVVIVWLMLQSPSTMSVKLVVIVAVAVMVAVSLRSLGSSFAAFADIAKRRSLVTRVFRATTSIMSVWKESGSPRLSFLGGAYLVITQTDARSFELVVHHADGVEVGYRLVPWSIRALNDAPISPDELSTLISELELRARHQLSMARPVPLKKHVDA